MPRVIDAFTQFLDDNGDPLANGWLRFTESGTNNTDKDTYADVDETIKNTNPLQLDGAGRCPNVFGSGSYNIRSYAFDPNNPTLPGTQIEQFDPVGGLGDGGALLPWNALSSYSVGDLVTGDNGKYYRSLSSSNQNNEPSISPSQWEEVQFLGVYNPTITYAANDVVIDANGYIYKSSVGSNLNNTPIDNPDKWEVAVLDTDLEADTLTHNMASDADYTLSGAENRFGRVVITDSGVVLTTTRNIIVSDAERIILANNNTLQILTFKTLAGTGIDVPPSSSRTLLCDGTNVIDISAQSDAATIQGVLCQHDGLSIINNTTNPAFQLDIAANELVVEDVNGNQKKIASISVTVDITVSGAGGLDTGTEASSTWYYVWVLAKADGTLTSVLSTSTTFAGVTKPTDYIFGGLVSAIYNDSGSNFINIQQKNTTVSLTSARTVLDTLAATTLAWTAVSIAAFAPPITMKHKYSLGGDGGANYALGLAPYSTGNGGEYFRMSSATSDTFNVFPSGREATASVNIMYASTSIYYYVNNVDLEIISTGWEY